ncbi:RelA/SpoT domain-containing protein [Candidatus Poribacteria bacterium]|nr:RelA/SpoT domain-containing protein [Candidatus Poribacteria bacterium]
MKENRQLKMNIQDYESFGRERYAKLCAEVHKLLERAIKEEKGYRLQHIQQRAKTVESLSRRLREDDQLDSDDIETHRKDLAGCRIVFYTNNDVNRFTQSDILRSLFEIDWGRSRIHQPPPGEESAANLFQSWNYVVKLKADRTELLEYREFEGLYCEVQVQTSLNHAWAEMAHDTIYKRSEFGGFGSREMELIEKRLGDVMRRHILPAGYHFQQIAADVQRLADGKALFDAGILEEILSAENNNDRHDHLMRLQKYVLPHYDGLSEVFPEIRNKLKQAWIIALRTETVPLETPFGDLDGFESNQVTARIAEIVKQYRYIEPQETYIFIRDLYLDSSSAESRRQLTEVAEVLARNSIHVWEQSGPAVQVRLAELLTKEKDIPPLAPLILAIANKILQPDIEGMTWHSSSVTIRQGGIQHSVPLEEARRKVLDVVATYAESVVSDDDLLRSAIQPLFTAGVQPRHGIESADVAAMVCSDLAFSLERIAQFAPKASLNARQNIESQLLHYWRRYRSLPQHLASDANVVSAHGQLVGNMILLRDKLNADGQFPLFKTIVGFQSVFPHEWEEDSMDLDRRESYRRQQQQELADGITEKNWPEWKSLLATAAKVESNNGATFPPYVDFLTLIAERHESLAFDLLKDREIMPAWTIRLIGQALLGTDLRNEVEKVLGQWLKGGLFVQEIADLIAHANNVNLTVVRKIARRAIDDQNQIACVSLLVAAIRHFGDDRAFWLDQIFFPCLKVVGQANMQYWMQRYWDKGGEDSLFFNLDQTQTDTLLEALVEFPRIDYELEQILQLIASKDHKKILEWFGDRIAIAAGRSLADYDPVPFEFQSLHEVLQPHVGDIMVVLMKWRERQNGIRAWQISHFLSRIYPNFEEPLPSRLVAMVNDADIDSLELVASSLHGYKGREDMLPLLRKILASNAANEEIEKQVAVVIRETGVMSGEFGPAQTYQAKANMLTPWLEDDNARVSAFARRTIHELEQIVSAENRRAEEEIAMRRLQQGEPLDDNGSLS